MSVLRLRKKLVPITKKFEKITCKLIFVLKRFGYGSAPV
jgi:hypothetical protein